MANILGHYKNTWKNAFIASSIGHLLLLIIFVLLAKNWSFDSSDNLKTIKFIKSSVKVDMVAMPVRTLKQLKHINISQKEDESIDQDKKEVLDNSQGTFKKLDKKVSLMDRLKQFADKEVKVKKKKKKNNKESKLNLKSQNIKNLVLAGNKLSQGNSLTGDSSEVLTSYEQYISSLPDQIRPNWKLPSYLMGKGLKCRIKILINKNGEIKSAQVYESSGEKDFDRRALNSVYESAPFDEPPQEIWSKLQGDALILGFPI